MPKLESEKVKTCQDCRHYGNLNKSGTKTGCRLLNRKFPSVTSACFLADYSDNEIDRSKGGL